MIFVEQSAVVVILFPATLATIISVLAVKQSQYGIFDNFTSFSTANSSGDIQKYVSKQSQIDTFGPKGIFSRTGCVKTYSLLEGTGCCVYCALAALENQAAGGGDSLLNLISVSF